MPSRSLLSVLLAVGALGCKPRVPAGARTLEGPTAAAPTDDRLPPSGSASTFDLLVAKNGGTIPYPFKDLVAMVAAGEPTARPDVPRTAQVLIPLGRSGARGSTDLFLPRVVTAFRFGTFLAPRPPLVTDGRLSVAVDNRVFLGYSERAKSIEILSYNDRAGRFEFQEIRRYAKDETPELFYADRSRCLSCHQAGGPIFAASPWFDTNDPSGIRRRLVERSNLGGFLITAIAAPEFNGVPVSPKSRTTQAGFIESSMRMANHALSFQNVWRRCGAPGVEAGACRKAVLAFATLERASASLMESFQPVAALLAQGEDKTYEGLAYPILSDYRAFLKAAVDAGITSAYRAGDENVAVPYADIVRLHQFARGFRPAAEDLPTTPRHRAKIALAPYDPKAFDVSDVVSGISSGYAALAATADEKAYLEALAPKATRDAAALEALFARAEFASVLANDVFVSADYLGALHKAAVPGVPFVDEAATLSPPAPKAEPKTVVNFDPDQSKLAPVARQTLAGLLDYCGACHSGSDDRAMGFLSGDDEEAMWRSVVARKADIMDRLAWVLGKTGGAPMPQEGSELGDVFRKHADAKALVAAWAAALQEPPR